MKTITVLVIIGLGAVIPSSYAAVEINSDVFPGNWIKYKARHEIFNMMASYQLIDGDMKTILYFVEADITQNSKLIYRGLYTLVDNKVTKLLDNGKDTAFDYDALDRVIIGASDGLYVYKADINVIEKYGTLNDDIISVAIDNSTSTTLDDKDGGIYIVTANKEVYKVSDRGTKKEKIDNILNAEQIVLDSSNNIFFCTDKKQLYVRTNDGVKKIRNVKENPLNVILIKPTMLADDIVAVVDNLIYHIHANGTSEQHMFEFKHKPTGYATTPTLNLDYYAHYKKIYEYDEVQVLEDIVKEKQNQQNANEGDDDDRFQLKLLYNWLKNIRA